ncbi:MAG: MotA/TolQ/ExbB proton channel family protein [bacterium]
MFPIYLYLGCNKKNDQKKISPTSDINIILSFDVINDLGKENFNEQMVFKKTKDVNPSLEDIIIKKSPPSLVLSFFIRVGEDVFEQDLVTNPSVIFKKRGQSISDSDILKWLSDSLDKIEKVKRVKGDSLQISFKHVATATTKVKREGEGIINKEKISEYKEEAKEETKAEANWGITEGSFFKTIKKGGLVMIPIAFCSIIGLYIILERTYRLRESNIIPSVFVNGIYNVLSTQDINNAISLCEKNDLPIARVLKAGLLESNQGIASFRAAIESAGAYEAAVMEQHIGLLGVLANMSPLLGLLGTILGMIKCFDTIAATGNQGIELARGISEALITTAGGLIVGIPLLIFFYFFQGKIDNILIEMEEIALEVIEKLSFNMNTSLMINPKTLPQNQNTIIPFASSGIDKTKITQQDVSIKKFGSQEVILEKNGVVKNNVKKEDTLVLKDEDIPET